MIYENSSAGKGKSLFDRILSMKIPTFAKRTQDNLKIIEEQIQPYLKDLDAHNAWKSELVRLDSTIDKAVYTLYGLSDNEIEFVETNSRPSGWHPF